jgi:hypothetical protein
VTTGETERRLDTDVDVCGLDWWGKDRMVLCLGNISSQMKTVRVVNLVDFKTLSKFDFEAPEAADAQVLGDVLLISSLYRNYGLDLKRKKIVWTAFQRHQSLSGNKIYFGAPEQPKDSAPERHFGVCDPNTGDSQVLYREKVEVTTTSSPVR